MGFSVKRVKTGTRNNLVAHFGQTRKYLCLYGHMDTVPPNTGMENPYKLIENGPLATGLGAADMKGGIAAILAAAHTAVNAGQPLKLVFGVDEENISQGSHDLINSGAMEDAAFLISGESGEVKAHQQPFNVCYGRKGRILFEVQIFGKRAHAARSKEGINAISEAAKFVNMVNRMKFPMHEHLGETNIVVQEIQGNSDSFSVPDLCTVKFSLLTTPNVKSQKVIGKIERICNKKNINVVIKQSPRNTPYGESYEVNRKNKFLLALEKEIFIPGGVNPVYTSSVADENVFANGLKIPVISMGPISGGHHSATEWINMDSLKATTEAYKQAIFLFNT